MLIYNSLNIIPAGTVMNTTINSQAMQLKDMVSYAIQVFFTGTPTGSFKLQGSNDRVTQADQVVGANGVVTYTPVHWSDVVNSTFTVTAAGDCFWDFWAIPGYNFVRVVYTDGSSGDSTAIITSAVFNAKGI